MRLNWTELNSAIWGQYLTFSHPEFPKAAPLRGSCRLVTLDGRHSLFLSWVPSGLSLEVTEIGDDCDIFCLLMWQAAFFVHRGYYKILNIIPSGSYMKPLCFLNTDFSVQFSHLVVSDCDSMDCSNPGFPVHHQLPELAQTHVHQVSDAIQPSHPLSSPSPLALCLSQHQGPSQWFSTSHQVAKVLEFQLQHQSFQWIIRADFLQDWLVGSPCSPWDFQESSPAPQFEKHQFFDALPSLWSNSTSIHDYWKNHTFDQMDICWQIDVSVFFFKYTV